MSEFAIRTDGGFIDEPLWGEILDADEMPVRRQKGDMKLKYEATQPRDDHGRWTAFGQAATNLLDLLDQYDDEGGVTNFNNTVFVSGDPESLAGDIAAARQRLDASLAHASPEAAATARRLTDAMDRLGANWDNAPHGVFRELNAARQALQHALQHGKGLKFDENQPRNPAGSAGGGRWTSGGAGDRPVPIVVKDVDEAVKLILEGKVVELSETRHVNTVLTKLAAIAKDAEAKGDKAPTYDLCKVSVKGCNLFCAGRVRTAEHPEGIARLHMPQMSGTPVPGSDADKLPKDAKGRVDGTEAFVSHLKSLGIATEKREIAAATLKASQAELVGSNVAAMMSNKKYNPADEPIFASRDNYVVDGHHRWAATVGRDADDGKLGDLKMKTIRIDAPISEVLLLANKWAKKFGITPQSGKSWKYIDILTALHRIMA